MAILKFLSIICIITFLSIQQLTAESTKVIKIGALIHLTGDLAMQGEAFRQGIEVAVDELNESGGINGAEVQVIFEDTKLLSKYAHSEAKKLLEIDGVVAGLVTTSAEAKAAGVVFEKKKTPLICLWDSAPEIEAIGDHVFGIGTWTPSTGNKVAEYSFNVLGLRQAAIINNIDEWSISVSNSFKERFLELGGSITFSASINPDETDFRSVISKMKLKNPEMLYAPIGFNIASFFKQLSQQKYSGIIFESDNLNEEIINSAGSAVEGVYQTQSANPKGESFLKFKKKFKTKFGKFPTLSLYSAWGYDSVLLIANAVKKVGLEPEEISNELYKVQNYRGASGEVSISSKGSSKALVRVFQVRNGKLQIVN